MEKRIFPSFFSLLRASVVKQFPQPTFVYQFSSHRACERVRKISPLLACAIEKRNEKSRTASFALA